MLLLVFFESEGPVKPALFLYILGLTISLASQRYSIHSRINLHFMDLLKMLVLLLRRFFRCQIFDLHFD